MEPKFTQQWECEPKPSAPLPLSTLLEANRDDEEICDWAPRAPVGGSLITGGGAAPTVWLRRVS